LVDSGNAWSYGDHPIEVRVTGSLGDAVMVFGYLHPG
jgi:hypothetical protein